MFTFGVDYYSLRNTMKKIHFLSRVVSEASVLDYE